MRPLTFGTFTSALSRSVSRRTLLRGASVAGAATLTASTQPTRAAKREKVTLCHLTGNGSYRMISVAPNAVSAHLKHGDFEAIACNGSLSCFPPLPLFCDSGSVCPTGATEFCPGGAHEPTSSEQARAACEACFGVGACVHNDLDCSGAGWLEDFTPQSQPPSEVPVFGYENGICNPDNPQPAGRVFSATASDPTTDYGAWGTSVCP